MTLVVLAHSTNQVCGVLLSEACLGSLEFWRKALSSLMFLFERSKDNKNCILVNVHIQFRFQFWGDFSRWLQIELIIFNGWNEVGEFINVKQQMFNECSWAWCLALWKCSEGWGSETGHCRGYCHVRSGSSVLGGGRWWRVGKERSHR